MNTAIINTKPRTVCDCGATEFYVNEGITHKADTDDDGKLVVFKRDWANEVEAIICTTCDHTYQLDEFDSSELF